MFLKTGTVISENGIERRPPSGAVVQAVVTSHRATEGDHIADPIQVSEDHLHTRTSKPFAD